MIYEVILILFSFCSQLPKIVGPMDLYDKIKDEMEKHRKNNPGPSKDDSWSSILLWFAFWFLTNLQLSVMTNKKKHSCLRLFLFFFTFFWNEKNCSFFISKLPSPQFRIILQLNGCQPRLQSQGLPCYLINSGKGKRWICKQILTHLNYLSLIL